MSCPLGMVRGPVGGRVGWHYVAKEVNDKIDGANEIEVDDCAPGVALGLQRFRSEGKLEVLQHGGLARLGLACRDLHWSITPIGDKRIRCVRT